MPITNTAIQTPYSPCLYPQPQHQARKKKNQQETEPRQHSETSRKVPPLLHNPINPQHQLLHLPRNLKRQRRQRSLIRRHDLLLVRTQRTDDRLSLSRQRGVPGRVDDELRLLDDRADDRGDLRRVGADLGRGRGGRGGAADGGDEGFDAVDQGVGLRIEEVLER